MNDAFWNRQGNAAAINYDITRILSGMYFPDPTSQLRDMLSLWNVGGFTIDKYDLSPVITPTVFCTTAWGLCIFAGGTSGTIHVPELLEGWLLDYPVKQSNQGATRAFANGARDLFQRKDSEWWASHPNIYLAGHSYGGAIMQSLGLGLKVGNFPVRGIWSYGSPRPGNVYFQRLSEGVPNYRFFLPDDPVRFIPPHTDETPILSALSNTALLQGIDTQVQSFTGYQITQLGDITPTAGDPTVLHAVATSVAAWCADAMDFRSVLHAPARYQLAFLQGKPINKPLPRVPPKQVGEEPEVGTIRDRGRIQEIGIQQLEQELANPQSPLNNVNIGLNRANTGNRYKKRKVGRIWGVKLGDDLVGFGPGKRKAGQLARRLNKAAFGR